MRVWTGLFGLAIGIMVACSFTEAELVAPSAGEGDAKNPDTDFSSPTNTKALAASGDATPEGESAQPEKPLTEVRASASGSQNPKNDLTIYQPLKDSSLEDPSGRALAHFFDALEKVQNGEPLARTTIVQFGDSHTAGDLFSGEIRRGLQRKFGDAGRGFLFPGKPFKYYIQQNVKHGASGPWSAQNGLYANAMEPLGLGGIRLTGSSPKAKLYVETCSRCDVDNRVSAFEILFWRNANGGWFQVDLDGEPARAVSTRSGALASSGPGSTGYFRLEVAEGPHRLELRPDEGTVDLFGIILEKEGPGVAYDALGLNGAWVGTPLRWSWELSGVQLMNRNPDLLITWYGTNETSLSELNLDTYPELYRELWTRLRYLAPDASCLIVGPPDRAIRDKRHCPRERKNRLGEIIAPPPGCEWRDCPTLDNLISVQRAVALELGCAFWDMRDIMGGEGSMDIWARMDPPLGQPDRTHLSRAGYEQLGDFLLNDLLIEFEIYEARKAHAQR